MAHGLKGVAANLGATGLAEAARELEFFLKTAQGAGSTDEIERGEALAGAVEAGLKRLSAMLAENPPAQENDATV